MYIKRIVLCVQIAVGKGSHLTKFYTKFKNKFNPYPANMENMVSF